MRMWAHGIEDILGMRMQKAEGLVVKNRFYFLEIVLTILVFTAPERLLKHR